jgi:riboflavin kinase/FMN adenylyltransferase
MLSSQRVRSLHQLGIDSVGLLRFNESMTRMTADEFARRILHDRLQAREVWVGPEFAYGHRRGGNLDTLQEQGSRLGFTAHEIEPQHLAGERISSSVIRQQLGAGEFAAAEQLLGRPYRIEGKVVHGAKLGRTLGFPTANIRYSRYQPVLHGIYACWVNLADGRRLPAVASFGTRPTVNGTHHEPLLEVHLFDFEGDLYGQRIGVDFAAKLRDEKKFDSLEALTAQMHRDADEARQVLNSHFTLRATA